MNLCDYNTIRDLLARHGFHFSKSMGQNFLIDPEVPRRIAEASGADAGCGVLEIGPGIGPLTAELAQRAGKVVAVELDRALLPVLAREIPLKAHAHQANDIFTALRIAREFDLRLTLEHVTEGHLIADELAKEKDVPMAVGPSLTFASKFELQNKSWKTPGVLANAGCHVSIITDNSVIPQQYLPLCAGMAVKAGMDPFDALKAITINPAEHIGVADRVGSLEVGKDADVVITNGCPFEVLTEVKAVFIDGARIAE